MKFSIDKILGGLGKGSNSKYLLLAAGVGGLVGYMFAKNGGMQSVFQSNYAIPSNMVAMGYNALNHTNLTDETRWNALPNPNLEVNVPIDAFDRMATIQGAYGQQYSYIGTPS